MKITDKLMLETLTPGLLITYLRCDSSGEPKPTGAVMKILDFNTRAGVWRYTKEGSSISCGHVPMDGGRRDFMSKNAVPDYWISANPEHVKASLRIKAANLKAAEKAAKIQSADETRRMKEFLKEFALLRKKYEAEIFATQVSGDDQGVEIEMEISIGSRCQIFKP
jgi:hypothetical protein